MNDEFVANKHISNQYCENRFRNDCLIMEIKSLYVMTNILLSLYSQKSKLKL